MRILSFVACGMLLAGAVMATPLGTAFTYQGQLVLNGTPVNGSVTLRFNLFDSAGPTGGNELGSQIITNVPVSNGLFVVTLNDAGQFTPSAFNGDARWLLVSVCNDPACNTFSALLPRQPLLATPYARFSATPWQTVPGGLAYNSGGNVGIGTTTPAKRLSVAGDMEIGLGSNDLHHLRIGGGNTDGFLYGSYPLLGDGIHMGYNFYGDGSGTPHIIATDGQTSRISMGYGTVALATGGTNAAPVNRLSVNAAGNVGIGTDAPVRKLEVHGDIGVGTNGQFSAPGGDENLRIVRASIRGGAPFGYCFSLTHVSTGTWDISFCTPFAEIPTMTATARSAGVIANVVEIDNTTTRVVTWLNGVRVDVDFDFIAIGPR